MHGLKNDRIMPTMLPINRSGKNRWINLGLLVILLLLVFLWLYFTPEGVDGKTRAAGYAVCHQLDSHTIDFAGKFLPLCARCTGTFLGTLITLIFLQKRKHAAGTPSKPLQVVLILFLIAFIVDGVNSTLGLFPSMPQLYPPSNLVRMITGFMMGMVIGNLLIVLWHQTWWKQMSPLPALSGWKHFLIIFAAIALAGVIVWLRPQIMFYPIAILSTAAIFLLLGMIYCLIWIIIFKKENSFEHYREGLKFLLAGLATAVLQVGALDLLRYSLTGTWQGFLF